jgi:hypothetical protein
VTNIRVLVALVVTFVWASGCALAFLSRDPALVGLATVITPVMLAVVGWLFAEEFLQRRRVVSRAEADG